MKLALSIMNCRIAPVLDYSRKLIIVELKNKKKTDKKEIYPIQANFIQNINILTEKKIDVLVCGAVSKHILNLLEDEKIVLIPWICGKIDDVIEAYINDNLDNKNFYMPGVYEKP